jgi:acetate kinase
MILLFEPAPPYLKWGMADSGRFSEGKSQLVPELFDRIKAEIGDTKKIDAIGHLLYHGGDEITDSVSVLTLESLRKIEKSIRYLPEYNGMTFKTAQWWQEKLPDALQILFCDTAFFTSLPKEASTYAIPYELREKGVKRHGGYGLCHQWAWKKIQSYTQGSVKRMVSIYLGNQTNLAAIKDGIPLETTIGLTPVEGIPSSNSCGDVDPTIVFQLYSAGMRLEEINQLLSRASGFSGLLGKPCSYLDLIQNEDDPEYIEVLKIYSYNIIKYTGACISLLGGADAIVFVSENIPESLSFILKLGQVLNFLGTELKAALDKEGNLWELSKKDSPVKVFCLQYDRWEVMLEEAATLLKKEV